MNRKRIIYWSITAALIAAGLCMSIVQRGGHYAFEWRGSDLMAQPKNDEYHDLASLEVFNRVLLQLQQNYVDASRLNPYVMISSALDNLQKNVPELLLVFDKKVKDIPTKVTVRIQGQSREFSLTDMDNLWEMSLRLRTILAFIQDYLPQDIKPRELEYDAINGMLSALDPHSLILSPEVYQNMMEGNRGKFGGLGIVVRMVDGVLIVVEPVHGDVPAKRAGMQEGDQIIAIDGTPTLNMNISEAVDLLKGEPDTTVHLTVMRSGWKEAKKIDVVRAEISIPSLESAALSDKIAYVKLKSFQGNSQSDMVKALTDLNKQMSGINGLILDLRGNPGGLLDQAVLIADNFLDAGTIVTTVGINDLLQKTRIATTKQTQPSYGIIVLVDSSSASASEIVAGALKNNDRALIAGDTSFGKGSVQVLYELPDKSALKLTIGQYLTPGNVSIQSVGIVPDVRFVPMLAAEADAIDLYPKPWVRREASLGSHLDNQNAAHDQKPSYNLRYLSQRYDIPEEDALDDNSVITLEDIDKIIKNKPKSNLPQDDPQVRLAHELLKKIGNVHTRPEMIQNLAGSARPLESEEDARLIQQLGRFGIDWSAGPQPSALSLSASVTTDKVNNTVAAGGEYIISATVANEGTEPVYRVAGRSESTLSRINDKEFIFGRIDPGQSVTRTLKVKTNRAQVSRVDNFDIKLYLDDGSPIPEKPIADTHMFLTTESLPQPSFAIHYAVLDKDIHAPSRTGNGLLDDNEEITVRLWVSNQGEGTAQKPLILLKNSSKNIKLIDARAETEALEKGQMVSRDFKFKTGRVGQEDIVLELQVYDKASTHSLIEKIAFKTSKNEELKTSDSQPSKGTKRLSQASALYVSPLDSSNTLMTLEPGTVVQTDAAVGEYTHISADPVIGWVASSALEEASSQPVSALQQTTITTTPRISLGRMPHLTKENSVRIEADLKSWAELKDYYIYTASEIDHTYQFEKVAYMPIEKGTSHIAADVPLQPGMNTIRLFVRDKNKSESHETILVYKE